jgi:3'-phosphoadenosine 5'-phosphosulfate sulfotransferase (PAPS reductase)/FAD synthetase
MGNEYRLRRPAMISFSGGRTSAYMLKHIIDAYGGELPDDIHVVFANTGKEAPETLDFVQECSERWNVPITWVEFDPTAEHLTRIVNHNSASRQGEPLKAAIETRPTAHLFNRVSRYCTATTKLRRMQKFMLHWCGYKHWTVALGIRHDEPRRVASNRARSGIDRQDIDLPLDDAKVTNEDVLAWWAEQPFQLRLPIVEGETIGGNCDLCSLKAEWKILLAMRQNPDAARWWIDQEDEMERRIADIPPTNPDLPDFRHRFLKNGKSYRDLLAHAVSDKPILKGRNRESVDCACTD